MRVLVFLLAIGLVLGAPCAMTQEAPTADVAVVLRSASGQKPVPALVWLSPAPGTSVPPFTPHGDYMLVQRNRAFEPHLQVVPVGAVVQVPNRDPFFHNVFSLFDGKRFDLGLYERGSTKAVTFPREGVSYIFCNIHPEMSAVIVALASPLYSLGVTGQRMDLRKVPPGDYDLKVWIEGAKPDSLNRAQRRVHVQAGTVDLGEIVLQATGKGLEHANLFGKPYLKETRPTY